MHERLEQQMEFLREIDKLKKAGRICYGSQDSAADVADGQIKDTGGCSEI